MTALDRKLLRDLKRLWSQALTLALVVAAAVAGFITTYSAYDSLQYSRDRYHWQVDRTRSQASTTNQPRVPT